MEPKGSPMDFSDKSYWNFANGGGYTGEREREVVGPCVGEKEIK